MSGGQTGADRAALDFAIDRGFEYGGFVPQGRTDERGQVPQKYLRMTASPSDDPAIRTALNLCASDGTVIFARGDLSKGSLLTAGFATSLERPLLHIDPSTTTREQAAMSLTRWMSEHQIAVLNVAGPRESDDPSIYQSTLEILKLAFPTDVR